MRRWLQCLRWLRWCLVLGSCLSSGSARAGDLLRFALVLGNNRAEGARAETLQYADDDALQMHLLLSEAGVQSRLLVRLDSDTTSIAPDAKPAGVPSAAELARHARELFAEVRAANARGHRTELLFFFSGHGDVEGGEGFLILESGRLTRSQLYDLLRDSPATTNHVLVDACRSYFMAFERGSAARRTPYAGPVPLHRLPGTLPNTGFVLSTTSNRESHEWERYQGGILSHELRSAMRGAADVDLDGQVRYGELASFLTVANSQIENRRFRPDFTVVPPEGNLDDALLAWNREATVQIMPGATAHFYVETPRGERVLDAHPDSTQALQLWLPAARPLFIRAHDERSEFVVDAARAPEVRRLLPSRDEFASKGYVHIAFTQLFAEPFGARSVRAFRLAPPAPPIGDDASAGWDTSRAIAGWTAIGAAAVGLTFAALSFGNYLAGDDASNARVAELNRRVERFNRFSLVSFSVAGASALTWATLRAVAPSDDDRPALEDLENSAGVGLGFSLRGRF